MKELSIYKKGKIIGVSLVDDSDYEVQSKFRWFEDKDGYIYRRKQINKVCFRLLLHREIMKCPDGLLVDHRNHNRRDNQKENLRICTSANNNHNRESDQHSSKYKGVFWNKVINRYQTKIMCKGVHLNLGISFTEEHGALLYNKKAKELHGEFAVLNELPYSEADILLSEGLRRKFILKPKTSKYVGVKKQRNSWIAYYKQEYLGSFKTEDEAGKVVDDYELSRNSVYIKG